MKFTRTLMAIATLSLLTSCAQVGGINQQLADWAGKMIEIRDGHKPQNTDVYQQDSQEKIEIYKKTKTVKSNIDQVFVKLKRKFNLKIRESVPGVYYNLTGSDSVPNQFARYYAVSITLDKEGNHTLLRWETYGTEEYAKEMERRILSVIK